MKTNRSRLLDSFREMVAIDSPSYGERNMGDYIKKQLLALGLSVFEDNAGSEIGGNCGNIYGFLEGSVDADPLLFCAHMDTVEPASGKQAIVGEDGVIRSNGKTVLGADDVSGIAAILEALAVIKEQNIMHRPIEVLFTVAEEVYAEGIKQLDFTKLRSKEAYVLDLTGPVGTAAYKAPTILSVTATITGKASHAGFAPEKGVHAIAVAADAISKLRIGRIGDDTTINIGLIEGGQATNIIPDRCVVKGEIRSYSHAKALVQTGMIKTQFENSAAAFGATVQYGVHLGCKAYETDPDHPVVKRFEKACATLELPFALTETFGGSDQNVMAGKFIDGLVIACAMNQCHSTDENTTLDELGRIAELTLTLMTKLS